MLRRVYEFLRRRYYTFFYKCAACADCKHGYLCRVAIVECYPGAADEMAEHLKRLKAVYEAAQR